MSTGEIARPSVATARRIVVKVGSSSLTGAADGGLDPARLVSLVDAVAARRLRGDAVILVSSGAIAAGLAPLGLATRPRDLASQQAAASVGQGLLVAAYTEAFAAHGLTVGQVLLTIDDVTRRSHYTNARRTLERLLDYGIVPVVNENDTVATHEIRFGDNDRLAALVAHLVGADALLLLSDVDALYDAPPGSPGARRVDQVHGPEQLAEVTIDGSSSRVGTGGMATKTEAAFIAGAAGIPTVLTSAAQAGAALDGRDVGTLFHPSPGRRSSSRKLWLAHATAPQGRVLIDPGAVAALVERRKSLLPAGIVAVEGRFAAGEAIEVCDRAGVPIARGLVNYSSEQLPRLIGRSTRELATDLGPEYEREVIHRDHLVVLSNLARAGTTRG